MQCWRVNDSADALRPFPDETARPEPGPSELLIQVHAAGVTPSELQWYPTTHQKSGEPRGLAIPCHEFSGTIVALGPGGYPSAEAFRVGDEVFGMNDWFAEGALAEFCLTAPSAVAPKPASLTHAQAATVPIAALTAWQGLFDRVQLHAGERVLIHGGSGSVGVFAIQLARGCGAHVITTASARNSELLHQLGAGVVIDYHTARFEDVVQNVDVVFDAVGGSMLERSWNVLRPGGRLVTVAAAGEAAQDERAKQAFFIVEPRREQLREIVRQIDVGALRPVVENIVPFAEAARAFAAPTAGIRGCGKTVVTLIPRS